MAGKSAQRRAWRVARVKIDPRCDYCGEVTRENVAETHPRRATVEDIVPLSKGGFNARSNWALACSSCNQAKADGHLTPSRPPTHPRIVDCKTGEHARPSLQHYRMTEMERRRRKCMTIHRERVEEVERLARLARLPFSLYTPIPGVLDEGWR